MGTKPSGQPLPFSQKLDGLNSDEDFCGSLLPLSWEGGNTCILNTILRTFLYKER